MADDIRITNVEIAGRAGMLEGIINARPQADPVAIAVIAHPLPTEGGTMHTKAVFHAAKAFARINCPVLRFNFRGVGRSAGTFTGGSGEREDFCSALEFMIARYPGVPFVRAGGMSFGAWVAMTAAAGDRRVTSLTGIAPPVTRYDFSSAVNAHKPTFIVHGERDELIPLKDVRKFYGQLPEPKELVVIDGGDHLFDGCASQVGDAVEDLMQDFNG